MTGNEQNLGDMSMLDLFRQEVAAQTTLLTESLLAVEHQPADKKQLDTLMRAAHSLKGAARIMGLDLAVKVAHALEDCFVAAQQNNIVITSSHADHLLSGVDFLLKMSKCSDEDMINGTPALQPEAERILKNLVELKSIPQSSATSSPPMHETPEAIKPKEGMDDASEPITGPKADIQTKTVRVTAEHLNRILGLVDESTIKMRWLEPFAGKMNILKKKQSALYRRLAALRLMLEDKSDFAPARNELIDICREAKENLENTSKHLAQLDDFCRRIGELNERLYREAIASRMRPFGDCTRGFPRMMRDLARHLGKKVDFSISGQDIKVDREILEKLEAPLAHLLRNALDHGIEDSEQRRAAGKKPEGSIILQAFHQAGLLHIMVSDDGAGIDLEKVRQKIISKGLSSQEIAARLSEQEVLDFLFLPSFSTRDSVTEISGRGVGLDIVLNLAQELGGRVRIENRRPNGSVFHLQLPITLSVMRALLVEIAHEPFIFPLARVAHLAMADPSQTITIEGRRYLRHNGMNVGLINAAEALELANSISSGARWPIVIINDNENHYGLIVDRFLGELMVVVRPLDPQLGKVQDISAMTLLDDGNPALIVDVDDLLRTVSRFLAEGGLKNIVHTKEKGERIRKKRVVVADDSITVRELERKILQSRGYEVDVTVDGMEAWNKLRSGQYDLLISDVDMPRLNGIDLIRRIRQDPRLESLPVIIVSYKDREEDRLRGLEAGANYYLTKSSFQDDTFIKAVTDIIGEAV